MRHADTVPRSRRVPSRLPRRLLGVWAHPDDESYLCAALMARVVDSGGHVTVVCATRGELGGDPEVAGPTLGTRRERELIDAMRAVGVTDVRLLGDEDGACAERDPGWAAAELAAIVRDVRPDTVVTFGPDGITGHPDHIAVGRWATRAVALTADRSGAHPELLYATMTRHFVERHRRQYADVPLTVAGPAFAVCERDVALRVVPIPSELRRKRSALESHGSQTEPLIARLGRDRFFDWWTEECFRLPTSVERGEARLDVDTPSPRPLQTISKPARRWRAHSAITVIAERGHHPDENRTTP